MRLVRSELASKRFLRHCQTCSEKMGASSSGTCRGKLQLALSPLDGLKTGPYIKTFCHDLCETDAAPAFS